MKKFVVVLCVLTLVGGMTGTASAIMWDLNTGLHDGHWAEEYGPGGHGSLGSRLWGFSIDLADPYSSGTGQWAMGDLFLDNVVPETDPTTWWEYETTYSGVDSWLHLQSIPGLDDVVVHGITAQNKSVRTPNGIQFELDIMGSRDGRDYHVKAEFYGTPGFPTDPSFLGNYMDFGPNDPQLPNTHMGWGFETLTLEVSDPVPEPGTMFLLGSGLIGLFVLARKKFKR